MAQQPEVSIARFGAGDLRLSGSAPLRTGMRSVFGWFLIIITIPS
ncbi:MAG: hypothetical protein V3S24_23180 [Candidatus Tectomicrobia bacterium]